MGKKKAPAAAAGGGGAAGDEEADPPQGVLPPSVELARTRVIAGPHTNYNVEENYYAHAYASCGVDNSFSLADFQQNFSVDVKELDPDRIVFEMKGLSPALANAFRRILLAEVPTVAIEKVYIVNNTSIIQDEVLAHRLGLVPIRVDPRLFEYKADTDTFNETNTAVFRLRVRCTRDPATKDLVDSVVLSSALEWLPGGSELPDDADAKFTAFNADQRTLFPAGIAPVHDDILLAKLRPGQEIELEAHAVKGIGKTHAKWSPVGTAWYSLVPEVVLLAPVEGADAEAFLAAAHPQDMDTQTCFSLKRGKQLHVENSRGRARESTEGDARFAERVQLRKVKEHYVFTVESVGQVPAADLFTEAVNILKGKCDTLLSLT